jgi:hypothetical protein
MNGISYLLGNGRSGEIRDPAVLGTFWGRVSQGEVNHFLNREAKQKKTKHNRKAKQVWQVFQSQ